MKRTDDLFAFFEYELTSTPTSPFKDSYLRQASKYDLASALTKNSTKLYDALTKIIFMADGGAPLHWVYWNVPTEPVRK